MSRYFGLGLLFIFTICFSACSLKQERPKPDLDHFDINESRKDINFLILEALMNQHDDVNQTRSLQIYERLYNKTQELPYLMEALRLSFDLDDHVRASRLLDSGLKKFPQNDQLMKFYINDLLHNKEYKKAQHIIHKLLEKDKSSENYAILAYVYHFQKEYKRALLYYKKAYSLDLGEDILLKIVNLLDENLHQTKKAVEYLESHIRLQKSSKEIYYKLLQIYGRQTDVGGLISTFKLLYKNFSDEQFAKKVIELYMYEKDKSGVIDFLKQSGYNPDMLMDLYAEDEQYLQAQKVAKKQYKKTKNVEYLGRMAIYEYEANKNNINAKILNSISKKFEEVVEKMQLPLYLNYYGYLLIDHEVDIDKGVRYVQMALEKEPDSIYYIDSLAWGYYRQGKCKDALTQMEKIINKSNEEEIKKHHRIIKECLKKNNEFK
ncbi:MAG: hypothetical protein CR967_05705 [Proteobacteria bacterium]|nr:MAG: hypothetical protein CR967_05705 [Pseudomonadota bacterium]